MRPNPVSHGWEGGVWLLNRLVAGCSLASLAGRSWQPRERAGAEVGAQVSGEGVGVAQATGVFIGENGGGQTGARQRPEPGEDGEVERAFTGGLGEGETRTFIVAATGVEQAADGGVAGIAFGAGQRVVAATELGMAAPALRILDCRVGHDIGCRNWDGLYIHQLKRHGGGFGGEPAGERENERCRETGEQGAEAGGDRVALPLQIAHGQVGDQHGKATPTPAFNDAGTMSSGESRALRGMGSTRVSAGGGASWFGWPPWR